MPLFSHTHYWYEVDMLKVSEVVIQEHQNRGKSHDEEPGYNLISLCYIEFDIGSKYIIGEKSESIVDFTIVTKNIAEKPTVILYDTYVYI